MAQKQPFTWKPTDVVEVANASDENIMLELESGQLRLDIGRTLRLTASAMEQPKVKALLDAGKIKAAPYKLKVQPSHRIHRE